MTMWPKKPLQTTLRHEPRVETHLWAVLEFVRQAAGKTHTYVKFYGD